MRATLDRVLLLAFVFWSWVPVVTLGLTVTQPVTLLMGDESIYTIDPRALRPSRKSVLPSL